MSEMPDFWGKKDDVSMARSLRLAVITNIFGQDLLTEEEAHQANVLDIESSLFETDTVAVREALVTAFDEDRELETSDLVAAIAARVPLTETMSEQIDALRAWAKRRAKPASNPRESKATASTSRAAVIDL